MTFMTAVFSYNRGHLLENCVRSIEQFSPETTVVIFDDKSDNSDTIAALDRIALGGHEVIVNDTISTAERGNLYPNLSGAVHLARSRGFRFVHLVQDDTQFVWRSPTLLSDVTEIFDSYPLAGQLNAHFWKFATKATGKLLEGDLAYRLRRAPACIIGFVDVERLIKCGFQHQSNEAESAKHAASLGLETLALAHPVVSRVPWPMYARHRVMQGSQPAGSHPFLVKPLSDTDIQRLINRDPREPPYAEDYCMPWGWRCWKPYHWTTSYKNWIHTLLIVAFHRRSIRGLIPHRVGEKR